MTDIFPRPSGHFKNGAHYIHFPVYYEDTDAGGVVYYGNYMRFAERARTEALNLAGIEHRELARTDNVWFVVRRVEVDYKKPAFLDDIIVVKTELKEIRTTSLIMRQIFYKTDPETHDISTDPIAEIQCFVVCVNPQVTPKRIPDAVRHALNRHLTLHD